LCRFSSKAESKQALIVSFHLSADKPKIGLVSATA